MSATERKKHDQMSSNYFRRDALERVGATVVQAGLSVISVETIEEVVDLNPSVKAILLPAIAGLLAVLKAKVAKRVGNPDDASLLRH